MSRLHSATPPPTLSVLDRLLDDDPSFQQDESQLDYSSGLEKHRRAVLRDLQWLLNARMATRPDWSSGRRKKNADAVQETVLRFGLPDITTLDLKSEQQREHLRGCLRDTIERFEPRLDFVSVSINADAADGGRTNFKVTARLKVDPEPLKLTFDATVLWKNRSVEVNSS
ncbi:MAG: type VI secretion system baseplate subunit TssE [Planctomycetota bacterium]|jgi:type VI secretion system protein ImpF